MNLTKNLFFLILIIFLINGTGFAKDDCFPEKSSRLVNDYIGILSQTQQIQLENKLAEFSNSTSNQIAIVVVNDLCGYDEADYTIQLGEKWGVGQKEFDNGVVIMVKPTGPGGRKTFIAVGYGLEGAIPDAIAKRIVEKEMIPRFKNNDIYGGLDAATSVIMKLAKGEFSAEDYNKTGMLSGLFPFLIILFFILIFMLSRYQRVKTYASTNHVSFWVALALLNAVSNRHSGHYGNFRSGNGSFGGFGGGGFGGFGGGSFGGGGAGGSW